MKNKQKKEWFKVTYYAQGYEEVDGTYIIPIPSSHPELAVGKISVRPVPTPERKVNKKK